MVLKRVNLIQAKTILTKTNLPGCDYVINPYNGCQFACVYCYAAQIARWKHPGEEWGSFLDVKTNAPELLKKELPKVHGSIFFSSVTDPYVGLESKYLLTRRCLELLTNHPDLVSIQTKSPLVTRDIDLLKKFKKISIGFTVTSLDDQISRFIEPLAPAVSDRINAIKQLNTAGLHTYAFIGPVLPHFIKNKKDINQLLDVLQDAGVKEVWFEHLHLVGPVKTRLLDYVQAHAPNLVADFQQADTTEYRAELESVINNCLRGRGLRLGLGKVIYHRNLPEK